MSADGLTLPGTGAAVAPSRPSLVGGFSDPSYHIGDPPTIAVSASSMTKELPGASKDVPAESAGGAYDDDVMNVPAELVV